MPFDSEWITHKGVLTDDNRDYCSIALRGKEVLYVVADGSTKGTQSGDLAHAFVREIADRFIVEPLLSSADQVISYVGELSGRFKKSHPAGKLSFLILLDLGDSSVGALHAGDCRLGMIDVNNRITWLTRAHTLANAIEEIGDEALAQHESRHVLTRSFKSGKQCDLELSEYDPMASDNFIIATDGYWADLDNKQRSEFITKNVVSLSSQHDDVSCLLLSHSPKYNTVQTDEGTENFYLIKG